MVKPVGRDPASGHALHDGRASPGHRPADPVASVPQPLDAPRAVHAQGGESPAAHKRPREDTEALAARKRERIEGKSAPYLSRRTATEALARLNSRVAVTKDSRYSALDSTDPFLPVPVAQGEVSCRHFATVFATHRGKKAGLMAHFSSPDGIEEFFGGRLRAVQAQYLGVIAAASQNCKHLVNGTQLGRYLSNLSKALEHGRAANIDAATQSEANSLLFSANHVMALHVALKQKEGVTYFSAKLFEPNLTNNYMRVEASDAEGFANLTFSDLSTDDGPFARASANSQHLAAVCVDGDPMPPIPRLDMQRTAENTHLALALGMSAEFERLMADAVDLPRQQLLSLLEARSEKLPGAPGLYVALADDQPAAIRPFIEQVMSRPSLRDSRMTLLASHDVDGLPALWRGLVSGSAAAVGAYVSAIVNSELSSAEKSELLAARDVYGYPGLYSSMIRDQTSAIFEYVRAVAGAESLGDRRLTLLAASKGDGTTALARAVSSVQVIAIDAFVEAVTASRMGRADQVELLKGNTSRGVPALHEALIAGNEYGVNFYVRAVTATGLPEEDKRQLLEARDPAGVTGQDAALAAGQEHTVLAFRHTVMNSTLSAATKAAVTAAGMTTAAARTG